MILDIVMVLRDSNDFGQSNDFGVSNDLEIVMSWGDSADFGK